MTILAPSEGGVHSCSAGSWEEEERKSRVLGQPD